MEKKDKTASSHPLKMGGFQREEHMKLSKPSNKKLDHFIPLSTTRSIRITNKNMKSKFLPLLMLVLSLFMGSCMVISHGNGHGAMNRTGAKAHRESQSRTASSFGGRNYHHPNHFKRRHF